MTKKRTIKIVQATVVDKNVDTTAFKELRKVKDRYLALGVGLTKMMGHPMKKILALDTSAGRIIAKKEQYGGFTVLLPGLFTGLNYPIGNGNGPGNAAAYEALVNGRMKSVPPFLAVNPVGGSAKPFAAPFDTLGPPVVAKDMDGKRKLYIPSASMDGLTDTKQNKATLRTNATDEKGMEFFSTGTNEDETNNSVVFPAPWMIDGYSRSVVGINFFLPSWIRDGDTAVVFASISDAEIKSNSIFYVFDDSYEKYSYKTAIITYSPLSPPKINIISLPLYSTINGTRKHNVANRTYTFSIEAIMYYIIQQITLINDVAIYFAYCYIMTKNNINYPYYTLTGDHLENRYFTFLEILTNSPVDKTRIVAVSSSGQVSFIDVFENPNGLPNTIPRSISAPIRVADGEVVGFLETFHVYDEAGSAAYIMLDLHAVVLSDSGTVSFVKVTETIYDGRFKTYCDFYYSPQKAKDEYMNEPGAFESFKIPFFDLSPWVGYGYRYRNAYSDGGHSDVIPVGGGFPPISPYLLSSWNEPVDPGYKSFFFAPYPPSNAE